MILKLRLENNEIPGMKLLIKSQESHIEALKQINNNALVKNVVAPPGPADVRRRIGFGRPTEGVRNRIGSRDIGGEGNSNHTNIRGRIGGNVAGGGDSWKRKNNIKPRIGERVSAGTGVAVRRQSGELDMVTFSDEEDE